MTHHRHPAPRRKPTESVPDPDTTRASGQRAKPVSTHSRCKAQLHAELAKCGVQVLMSDLFGAAETELPRVRRVRPLQ